jgi:hypothetical protein
MASGRLGAVVLVLLIAGIPSACGGEEYEGLLSTVPQYDGGVRIEARAGDGTRTIRGELRFDRARGTISFRRADGIVLAKAGDGPLEKSQGETLLPLEPEEIQDFGLLLTALYSAPDPAAGIERSATGYVVRAGEQELHVALEPPPRD